jgi:hypothetical protein
MVYGSDFTYPFDLSRIGCSEWYLILGKKQEWDNEENRIMRDVSKHYIRVMKIRRMRCGTRGKGDLLANMFLGKT